ncbi:hypothetical protein HDU91_005148 [Kappamyces sp. JEL0680]|nr:hypothetical protein HDU91_005148 [Kappamyces sp. JEL0680]
MGSEGNAAVAASAIAVAGASAAAAQGSRRQVKTTTTTSTSSTNRASMEARGLSTAASAERRASGTMAASGSAQSGAAAISAEQRASLASNGVTEGSITMMGSANTESNKRNSQIITKRVVRTVKTITTRRVGADGKVIEEKRNVVEDVPVDTDEQLVRELNQPAVAAESANITITTQSANSTTAAQSVGRLDIAAIEASQTESVVEKKEKVVGRLAVKKEVQIVSPSQTETKEPFPVMMVADAGRFELKKPPTWMKRQQFVNPNAENNSTIVSGSTGELEDEMDDLDEAAPPAPTSHVAIQSYYPRNEDEMTIQNGDLIGIEKEYGDGWYDSFANPRARGQNISQSRKRGVFPLALVKPITSGPTQAVRRGKNAVFRGAENSTFQIGDLTLVPRTISLKRLQHARRQSGKSLRSIHSLSSNDSQ